MGKTKKDNWAKMSFLPYWLIYSTNIYLYDWSNCQIDGTLKNVWYGTWSVNVSSLLGLAINEFSILSEDEMQNLQVSAYRSWSFFLPSPLLKYKHPLNFYFKKLLKYSLLLYSHFLFLIYNELFILSYTLICAKVFSVVLYLCWSIFSHAIFIYLCRGLFSCAIYSAVILTSPFVNLYCCWTLIFLKCFK